MFQDQPTLHVHLINQAMPKEGEHVVHIGTGSGYYTAVMAAMVGDKGRVTGIEYEPEMAARAKANLALLPNVEIVNGDGTVADFDAADVIYVNAGATQPNDRWLDRLAPGGRMILPLTTDKGFSAEAQTPQAVVRQGAVFRIARREDEFDAKWISPVAIFPCAGGRDAASEENLGAALAAGRIQEVTRLYRNGDLPDARCWLKGQGWALAYS